MKQAKRVFCLVLMLVMLFTTISEPLEIFASAANDYVPTEGSADVGRTPETLQHLGEWVYWIEDGQAVVAGYEDKSVTALNIPARLGGCPVVGIGEGAFADNAALSSIQIPTNVTRIASDAFKGLKGLTVKGWHGSYALRYAEKKGLVVSEFTHPNMVFAAGIIDLSGLPSGAYSDLTEDGVSFSAAEASFLTAGQVLYFPASAAFPTGLAKRAEIITKTDDKLVVVFSQPEWGECFERVYGEDDIILDWENAIVHEGFELTNVEPAGSTTFTSNVSFNASLPLGKKFTLSGSIGIKTKASASWDIGLKWLLPSLKEAKVSISQTSTESVKLETKEKNPPDRSRLVKRTTIAEVPIASVGGFINGYFTFDFVVEVSGSMEISTSVENNFTFTYKNGKGSTSINKNILNRTVKLEASVKVGPEAKLYFVLGWSGFSIRFLEGTLGLYAKATASASYIQVHGTQSLHVCTDAKITLEVTASVKLGIIKILSYDVKMYAQLSGTIGPFTLASGHYDDSEPVEACLLQNRRVVIKVDNKTVKDYTATVNSSLTAPDTPSKKGHTFAGWYVDTKASGLPGSDYKFDFKREQMPYCGKNGTLTIYAKFDPIPVTKVTLNKDKATLYTSDSPIQLKQTVTPANAADSSVTWTSSNSSVASVKNGKVTPKKAGTATITCASKSNPDKKATFVLTVKQYAEKVTVTGPADEIFENETLQLSATVTPGDTSNKAVTWTSSNNAIATVSSSGRVTGVKTGTVTITATAKDGSGKSGKYTVHILKPVTGIVLDKTSAILYTNNTAGLQLNPTLTPSDAALASVKWETSNASVAKVSNTGLVTPVAPGTVTITCRSKSDSSVTATCTITVKQYVQSVSVSGTVASVAQGGTAQLTAAVGPANATDKSLDWTSSNPQAATVDQNGVVTGVAAGSAVITATAHDGSGVSDSWKLVVVPQPASAPAVNAESISIPASMTAYTVNRTAQIDAVVSPAGASQSVVWASSNESAATVDNTGRITLVRGGTTILTVRSATNPEVYANCTLRVVQSVETITIEGERRVEAGKSSTLTAAVTPDNAENKAVTWSSSDTTVATVDQNGKVTGRKDGVTQITATAQDGSGVSKTEYFVVGHDPIQVESITLDETEISRYMNELDGADLEATVLPVYADSLEVTWSTSNVNVATVDQNGHVTFVGPGTAIITCRSDFTPTISAACTVTVKQYVEQVDLEGDKLSLLPNETLQLTAVVHPDDATDKSLTWSTGDASVATVSQTGLVTAVGYGTVTITAVANDGSGAVGTYELEVEKELKLEVSTINDTVYTQGDQQCDLSYVSLTSSSARRMAQAGLTPSWSMVRKSGAGDAKLSTLNTTGSWGGTNYTTSIALLSGSEFPTAGTEIYTVTCTCGQFEESVDIPVTVDGTRYAESVQLTDKAVGCNTLTGRIGDYLVVPATPVSADGYPVPEGLSLSAFGDALYNEYARETMTVDGLEVRFDESAVYTARVTYTRGNLSYEVAATFQVADEDGVIRLRVEEIDLSRSFLTLAEGRSAALTATVLPADAYNRAVVWSSSDESVATVDQNGSVRAVAPGTALILCQAQDGSGVSAMCAVSVERYLQLDDNELSYTVYTGGDDHANLGIINVTIDSEQRLVEDGLNARWTLERVSGSSTEIGLSEYASPAEAGLSVSGNLIKLLRVNGAGTDVFRLTCSAGEYSDSCLVTVTAVDAALPTGVTLSTDSYETQVGEWFTLDTSYTLTPQGSALPEGTELTVDGGNAYRNALSSLYSYAEPEALCFETAGTYTANVIFSGANYRYVCPVTITVADEEGNVPANITDVTVNADELMLTVGDTYALTASVEPADAPHGSVSWASSDTAVATVSSSGVVTAIGPGYASITASVPESDYEGSCLIFVEDGITFRDGDIERTVFVDGETRMILDTAMLTDNTSARLNGEPEWTLRRVSGISLTLRPIPRETVNAQGDTLYGCDLLLYSVSKEGDTVYELTARSGNDTKSITVTVHAVNRDRVLPASISLADNVFEADVGELIVVRPNVTTYPAGSSLPAGIRVSCEGDKQYLAALNTEDTFVSQSLSTFSFNKAGTYRANLVYAYSNMKYVVPVVFRIRDANGDVPVQAAELTISELALYLTPGEQAKLDAVFTPADATNQAVTWSSTDPSVAAVDADGNVTAVAKGWAEITCTPADPEVSPINCAVTVEDSLTVDSGPDSMTFYLQGDPKMDLGNAYLSEGTVQRLQRSGVTAQWSVVTDGVTHSVLSTDIRDGGFGVAVTTESLKSAGTDTYTIVCHAGKDTWSKTYTLHVVDLPNAPESVTIRNTQVSASVGQAVTIDFTPVLSPAGSVLPEDMMDTGYVGVGNFYSAVDWSSYAENGDSITVGFTRPGRYLLTRRFLKANLEYVMACTITVGGQETGLGILEATETEYTVYSGGQSGIVSTVLIRDGVASDLWEKDLLWSIERVSGDSVTAAIQEHGSYVDVFVASVEKNGTDVWRVTCSFGGMTESVDITITADTPRSPLPESISLAQDFYTGAIGDRIQIPLGAACSPAGSKLPDQGDDFWSFRFDQAGEERSEHRIENGMLSLRFQMSGYYTGTLCYRSGNVSYELPVYFEIRDEEQEVRQPQLNLYALNTFDTVYPEGEVDLPIGQIMIGEGLSTYSTGAAVAYMTQNTARWNLSKTGTAAELTLRKASDNVYDLVLTGIRGSGDVSYTVSCAVGGKTYTLEGTLHVASADEPRPDATLKQTLYRAQVGETVTLDRRLYDRSDGSILQSSSAMDPGDLLSAVGYEIAENDEDWTMTFYRGGSYETTVSAQVANLTVRVPVTILVGGETAPVVFRLPAGVKTIEEEGFAGIAAEVIDLRGTAVKTIGAGAFKGCVNVTTVYLPEGRLTIADDAFYGCLNATFVCAPGSDGAKWAAAHGFPVQNP